MSTSESLDCAPWFVATKAIGGLDAAVLEAAVKEIKRQMTLVVLPTAWTVAHPPVCTLDWTPEFEAVYDYFLEVSGPHQCRGIHC